MYINAGWKIRDEFHAISTLKAVQHCLFLTREMLRSSRQRRIIKIKKETIKYNNNALLSIAQYKELYTCSSHLHLFIYLLTNINLHIL